MLERSLIMLITGASVICGQRCVAQPATRELTEGEKATQKRHCSPETGKSLLKDRAANDFVDWSFSELPKEIQGNVDGALDTLAREANPHKTIWPIEVKDGIDLAARVYAARDSSEYDLVEYRWTYKDRPLRVVQSLNAMSVDFDVSELASCRQPVRGPACVAAVRAWVEEVLKLEQKDPRVELHEQYKVEFPWPEELRDGVWFSSAPEQNLMHLGQWWWARVDAFVENGTLSILVYKKPPAMMGYPDGSKWFPDDFRQVIQHRSKKGDEK